MFTIIGKYSTATIMTDNADESVISQIYTMVNSPAINNNPIIMPDTHAGKGAVIGFTMRMLDKVIPNTIGVDIGCGMLNAAVGSPRLDPILADAAIRRVVPTGFNVHGSEHISLSTLDRLTYSRRLHLSRTLFVPFDSYADIFKRVGIDTFYALRSLGTLGGGNHFIEFGTHNERTFITIHTGSRNFGLKVATHHQKVAQSPDALNPELTRGVKIVGLKALHGRGEISGRELGERIAALNKPAQKTATGLEYLEGQPLNQYLYDMYAAQEYARINRKCILDSICIALELVPQLTIESVHNYIDPDDQIIRKGAIAANEGQFVIIPISRTFGTLIGMGKGNAAWNNSAPHGAGRVMSRSQAKKLVSQEDATAHMQSAGVYSSFDPPDEDDLAYRGGEEIMALIEPTVQYLYTIEPFLSIK